jgi:hypothetical protein
MNWWAKGLIFENCSCTLVCPGHMHFSQLCTHDRCKGYWALRFDEGAFDGVSLAGVRAVIVFDTPKRMIDGNWVQTIIIDESATSDQRRVLETMFTGRASGPWGKLAQFVGQRNPTEFRRIEFAEENGTRNVSIAERLKGFITNIKSRDKVNPVVFENIFNQIHGSRQILAMGDTEYADPAITIHNTASHGLVSNFDWSVK